MKREELESHVAEQMNFDGTGRKAIFGYYYKSQADSVMDAMESRIKELENKLEISIDNAVKYCDIVKELEASQPKWISVEERLPKECEAVVCLVDKWEEMSVCWIEYMYESKRWTDGDRDYPMDYYTHWMPLPQQPKSED